MRKTGFIFFLILLAFNCTALHAQQARFDAANDLLHQNQYNMAIEHYRSIADDGYHSGALWFNMGYAYSHIDSLGMAKFYLLKAGKYPESRELAAEALDVIHNRFTRRSAVLPPLPWDRFFQALSHSPGVKGLAYMAFIFLYMGVAFLIASWFRYDLRKFFRYGGYSLLGISATFFLFTIIVNYQENRFGLGVMVHRQAQVYQQPRPESAVITTAFEGYTMRVDFRQSKDYPEWKYVRLENGMYGWIEEDQLRVF